MSLNQSEILQGPTTETDMPVLGNAPERREDTGLLTKASRPGRTRKTTLVPAAPETPAPESGAQQPLPSAPIAKRSAALAAFIAFVNKPWLLITIPAIGGVIWLAQNTWVITQNLDKPYILLAAGPVPVATIGLLWLLVVFFKTISAWCKATWKAFQEWRQQDGATFWMVIIVFLIVSVAEAGTFFNHILQGNDLYGTLGYAIAGVIDLVAVVCIRARLAANRLHDKVGAQLYLTIIILCSGMSGFANVYTALDHFNVLPAWMHALAPWTSVVVPSLIIGLSFAADYTADQGGSSKLDPEKYKEQNDKRIKYLEYKRDSVIREAELKKEIASYHRELDPRKAALEKAREEGKIARAYAMAARVPFYYGWFSKPAPQITIPSNGQEQSSSSEKKSSTARSSAASSRATSEQTNENLTEVRVVEITDEDQFDMKNRPFQIIENRCYLTRPAAIEKWDLAEGKLKALFQTHPDIAIAYTIIGKRGGQEIPLVLMDARAEEAIKKAAGKKPTQSTPAEKKPPVK